MLGEAWIISGRMTEGKLVRRLVQYLGQKPVARGQEIVRGLGIDLQFKKSLCLGEGITSCIGWDI